MGLFDLASVIFFLVVIGFFLRPLFDGLIPGRPAPKATASPRSISESGGYRAADTPTSRKGRFPVREQVEDYRMPVDDVEARPVRPRRAATREQQTRAGRAARLRRRMHDHGAVQEAFIVKELLDPPVGMRGERR